MKGKDVCGHHVFFLAILISAIFLNSSHATLDGVYHRVRQGDTLWGISRTYRVNIDVIRSANRELAGTNIIKPGQRIFIPGAERVLTVEPISPQMRDILRRGWSSRWEYVVIHHSATRAGSATIFERNHRARGYRALGYHFVIGNGTYGVADGEIETGFRWLRQWDGAHTKGHMNTVGIGICLVGNFEENSPSRKQMESLATLVTQLAYKYDIPLENIKGHKDFNNTTRCPGKNFPWRPFRERLRERGIR